MQIDATSPLLRPRDGRTRARVATAVAVLLLAVVGWAVHLRATRIFLDDTARRAQGTLRLAATALTGYLDRFARLPPLLAVQPQVRALAEAPADPARVATANLFLRDVATLLGASDVYFMDMDGLTRAASNFDTATSFVGGNFAFRPYFTDALAHGAGRFYALGTTSMKRGYYFGAPVMLDGRAAGVLVVKIDVDSIEATWGNRDYRVLALDPEGLVFLSSEPGWRFARTRPPSPEGEAVFAATRRYADEVPGTFPLSGTAMEAGHLLWRVGTGPGAGEYLLVEQPMPAADWTLAVLQGTGPARAQALTATAGVVLGLALLGMGAAVVLQRRARLRDRLEMQAAARLHLEARVAERTRELAAVNQALSAEVAERRLVEDNLRRAQDDLVQAAKLAALGQMSAALGHEVNQPLGALRNYAENAATLIERGRTDEARGAIDRILSMADRMGAIARRLHTFGRRPGQRLHAIDLAEAVEAAREIADPRLRQAGADLTVDLPTGLPRVTAGPVRMQQVLVNLLTNAADAVADREDRRIRLSARATGGSVILTVEDSGAGVPPEIAARIFDPFFSTKGVGNGLGLGLSISYNILKDFGGELALDSGTLGGAAFRVDLRIADPVIDLAAE
jgi:two-component system C4-dicarboxylate transport sensor histidine kinase DctB